MREIADEVHRPSTSATIGEPDSKWIMIVPSLPRPGRSALML